MGKWGACERATAHLGVERSRGRAEWVEAYVVECLFERARGISMERCLLHQLVVFPPALGHLPWCKGWCMGHAALLQDGPYGSKWEYDEGGGTWEQQESKRGARGFHEGSTGIVRGEYEGNKMGARGESKGVHGGECEASVRHPR